MHTSPWETDQDTVVLSLASGYLYTCNQTTASLLAAVDGQRTFGQIVDLLEQQFDVSRERLHADLLEIADRLIREKLV